MSISELFADESLPKIPEVEFFLGGEQQTNKLLVGMKILGLVSTFVTRPWFNAAAGFPCGIR